MVVYLVWDQGVARSSRVIPTQYEKEHRGVEQLVARQAHNLEVARSSRTPATFTENRDVAQLVAHASGGREVASSSLVIPTSIRSLAVIYLL